LVLFLCLDTLGFAVEVAVELDGVLLGAAGAAGAVDWARTAAAVNIEVRIKRFILVSFSFGGAFNPLTLPIMRPLRDSSDNPAGRATLTNFSYRCQAILNE